jgi:dicarboxylate transporter 10
VTGSGTRAGLIDQAHADSSTKDDLRPLYQRCPANSWYVTLDYSPILADTAGVRGLYTGLTASIFRQMTYSIVRLGAYDKLKTEMAKGGRKLSTLDMVMCASGAGALGGLAGNPADIILVR